MTKSKMVLLMLVAILLVTLYALFDYAMNKPSTPAKPDKPVIIEQSKKVTPAKPVSKPAPKPFKDTRIAEKEKAPTGHRSMILEAKSKTDTSNLIPKGTLAHMNNNPLNVKRAAEPWQGQIGLDKFNHVQFSNPAYGVRAAAKVLTAYYRRHKIDTVEGIISRFCTAKGKVKKSYITFVAGKLGVKPNQKIDVTKRMPDLLYAMAIKESGTKLPKEWLIAYSVHLD